MNKIKCLKCNTILESKHRHDFRRCGCENQTFVDGGNDYQRVGGADLSLISFWSEKENDWITPKLEEEEELDLSDSEKVDVSGAIEKLNSIEIIDKTPDFIFCPFCGEDDFDLHGLKTHLVNGHCEVYNETSYSKGVFKG